MKSSNIKYHRPIIASLANDLVLLYTAHLYFHALRTLLLQYYTQIGLNIVTASAQSHSGTLSLDAPFEAYGKPDVPAKIVKVYPFNNVYGAVNNPAGSILSKVTDTHGNPVSNVKLTFKVQDAVSNNPETDPLPVDDQNQPLYKNLGLYTRNTCTNPYPIAGDCALSTSLTLTTHYYGAQVETILGNTLNTHYTVNVLAAGLDARTYDLYSDGARGQAGNYVPSLLMIWNLGLVNEKGEPVNAAKAGQDLKAPLTAKMYLLQDEYDIKQEQCTKSDSNGNTITFTGYSLVTRGTLTVKLISNGTVTFTAVQGGGQAAPTQNKGNGLYQATYKTGAAAAKNIIEVDGSATVTVPEIFGIYQGQGNNIPLTKCLESNILNPRTVTLKYAQYVLFDQNTHEALIENATHDKPRYTAYGVDTTLDIQPSIVLLNDQGYTTADTTLTYTIKPGDYQALRVDLDAYSKDQNTPETWDGYVVADKTQGQGTVVFVAGTPFDIAKLHKEQVVLNRGTDMEVRGEKTNIPVAQIRVLTDESTPKEADEIKFSDGSKASKRYKIEITSAALAQSCNSLAGPDTTIRTSLKSGQTATTPGEAYYPATYDLTLNTTATGCSVKIGGKSRFIVANRSTADLQQLGTVPSDTDTAVLYGGIGNNIQITLNGTALKEIPVEPVGIIVLAIDGLRQDVLYRYSTDEAANEASYNDPHGCGQGVRCYIQPSELKGLCDVLGGKYDGSCDPSGWDTKHIKLKDVTSIFPSITVASWASVFTGKMPSEPVYDANGNIVGNNGTGILGNEFFARDMARSVPPKFDPPKGMVTFGGGAMRGYDDYKLWNMLWANKEDKGYFFIPYQFNWVNPVDPSGTPQNDRDILKPDTVYEQIVGRLHIDGLPDQPGITGINTYFAQRGGDPVVVANNHYARGAYWLTWDVALAWGESAILDASSWDKLEDYLGNGIIIGKYDELNEQGVLTRNKVPFSVVTTWYLPGLDHQAHIHGVESYRDYFKSGTDVYVKKLSDRLKKLDEFDSKIFIIVADHGHTAMPTSFKYKLPTKVFDASDTPIDVMIEYSEEPSCKLNLDFGSTEKPDAMVMKAEQVNNNLHIWELGEIMRAVGENGWGQYKLLAPKEIARLYKKIDKATNAIMELPYGATTKVEKADIIVGLNGPMAHIYVTDINKLGKVAELFRLALDDHPEEAAQWWNVDELDYSDFKINTIGRLKTSVDKILVRVSDDYCVFDGLNDDGNMLCAATDPFTASEYAYAWERINGMNHSDRSGDIVLLMRDATYGGALDRYTTGVACKSWHGSLSPSDSYVPFIASYPGGNKYEIEQILKKESVCKTDYTDCKGNWKLSDVVKEIISEQYQ